MQREIKGRVVCERLQGRETGRVNWELQVTWNQATPTFHIDQPEFPMGIFCPFPAVSFPGGFQLTFFNLFLFVIFLCLKILPCLWLGMLTKLSEPSVPQSFPAR